jgi:hypothetical protein
MSEVARRERPRTPTQLVKHRGREVPVFVLLVLLLFAVGSCSILLMPMLWWQEIYASYP